MRGPCYHCEFRKEKCHKNCPDYISWAKEHEEEKEKIRDKKYREYETNDVLIRRRTK